VQKAIATIEAEVIVIDNCSVDNSIAYLQSHFPCGSISANTENLGFAKACNQGLQNAKGKYILFPESRYNCSGRLFQNASLFLKHIPMPAQ